MIEREERKRETAMKLFGSDSEVNKSRTGGVLAAVLLAGISMLSPGRVVAQGLHHRECITR